VLLLLQAVVLSLPVLVFGGLIFLIDPDRGPAEPGRSGA
jgi:hypothetical protein